MLFGSQATPWRDQPQNGPQLLRAIQKMISIPIPKKISPFASDLLRKLLQQDPTKRIASSELCSHPYLQFVPTEMGRDKQLLEEQHNHQNQHNNSDNPNETLPKHDNETKLRAEMESLRSEIELLSARLKESEERENELKKKLETMHDTTQKVQLAEEREVQLNKSLDTLRQDAAEKEKERDKWINYARSREEHISKLIAEKEKVMKELETSQGTVRDLLNHYEAKKTESNL